MTKPSPVLELIGASTAACLSAAVTVGYVVRLYPAEWLLLAAPPIVGVLVWLFVLWMMERPE